jgi:hypothetical protein
VDLTEEEDQELDFMDQRMDIHKIAAIVADLHIKVKKLVENQGKTIEEIVLT